MGEIETVRPAHHVGDEDRKDGPENPGSHTVEQLHAHQPEWIVRERVENGAHRQDDQSEEKERLATPRVRLGSDEKRHGEHHHLGRDDANGHQRRAELFVLARKLLPDERQHRRIREVEQSDTDGEDQERPATHEHRPSRTPLTRLRSLVVPDLVEAARDVVINRRSRNDQHAEEARCCHDGKQIEHHDWPEPKCREPRHGGRKSVPGMIEKFIATDALGERLLAHDPQRYRRERRLEDGPRCLGSRLRNRNRPKRRKPRQQKACRGDHNCRHDHDASFGARRIDERAGRRLRHDARDRGDRHRHPDALLIPFLDREQIDREIRTEAGPHVGEKEVRRVEATLRAAQGARSTVGDHARPASDSVLHSMNANWDERPSSSSPSGGCATVSA